MKKIYSQLLILIGMLLSFQGLFAQDIITVNDALKAQKSGAVIVSVRSAADYAKVHITGAVHMDLNDLYKSGPVASMLKPAGEIGAILGQKGISNTSKIIVYDDGTGKNAGRMYWILDYLGASDVKILDGHMKAWRAGRKPVTKNPSSIKETTFTAKADAGKLATLSEVQKAVGNASMILIDARSEAEFNGTDDSDLKKGHIPGAINIEYINVMKPDGKLKSNEELKSFKMAGR